MQYYGTLVISMFCIELISYVTYLMKPFEGLNAKKVSIFAD